MLQNFSESQHAIDFFFNSQTEVDLETELESEFETESELALCL